MKTRTLIIIASLIGIGFLVQHFSGPKKSRPHTIAVVTLMKHPSLDSLQSACIQELAAAGYTDVNTRFVFRNGNGQITEASSIAYSLRAENPDIIIAITTPMAQAVVAAKPECPVVFAAVTDPVGAHLVPDLTGKNSGTITGASDIWPFEAQLQLIKKITPNVKTIGVLFNPGEAASQLGMKEIRKYAGLLNLTLIEAPVTSTNEVGVVAENLAPRSDALMLSSDNTVIAGVNGALRVALQRKLPLYVGDGGTVEKGGLATVSIGYDSLGRESAKLAVKLLNGERNVPVFIPNGESVFLNQATATRLGITLTDEMKQRAVKVFSEIKE